MSDSVGQRSSIRHIAVASFIGTAIEWYDFFLYGTAAALVFPRLFFPKFNAVAGTMASFATFGVGFIARPIGAFVFGHFGDRVGRKSALVITLLLMGVATFLIGVVPTFDRVGALAPTLLAVLRFLQGFAVGGEWGGATLMIVEHAPEESRNFYASWPQAGVPVGLLLSTAMFASFSSLPDAQFFSWGWRVPFLFSIGLVGIGLFIRRRVLESPSFLLVKKLGVESKLPLLEVLRDYPLAALLAVGTVLISSAGFYIVVTFTLSYVTERFGVPRIVPLIGVMVAAALNIPCMLFVARLADQVGKRRVAIWSAVATLLISSTYFTLINTRQPILIWLAMAAWNVMAGALYGITGVLIAELFPSRVRYSGISFGYHMAGMLGGAVAPTIATALVQWSGGESRTVAAYFALNALISLVAVYFVTARLRTAIHDLRPLEHQPAIES